MLNSATEIMQAGFSGAELCFSKDQFDPFKLTDKDLAQLKNKLESSKINLVAISTATTFYLSDVAHEPSVLSTDKAERQKRIDVIKQGIRVAQILGIQCVSFQSGYLRSYHKNLSESEINELLISAIQEVLDCIESNSNVTLVIEPEPGMYIESIQEAINLIDAVNHKKFKLHVDICHTYCTEKNYLQSIEDAAEYTAYMHLADIRDGFNLKLRAIETEEDAIKTEDKAVNGELFYVKDKDEFIFVSALKRTNITKAMEMNDAKVSASIVRENKAYLDSIELLEASLLERTKPALNYLRESGIIRDPICNTIQGKVHYHEFPGEGEIDFSRVMDILTEKYNGYVTVELYNHATEWETVLPDSLKYLTNLVNSSYLKRAKHLGDVDHRIVEAPYVRLDSAVKGLNGDYTCMYDLRFRNPNSDSYIDPIVMHSMEHCLIYFFRREFPSRFSCLAPMGCQTGFYLVLVNALDSSEVIKKFKEIMNNILNLKSIPYQSEVSCGQSHYHSLSKTKQLAHEIIEKSHTLDKVTNELELIE